MCKPIFIYLLSRRIPNPPFDYGLASPINALAVYHFTVVSVAQVTPRGGSAFVRIVAWFMPIKRVVPPVDCFSRPLD